MGICVSCRRRDRKGPEKRAPFAVRPKGDLLPRRDPLMANSISNIQMANPLKVIVSKRRKRYTKDGFNLDLAYITDRLIAMGFPAEKLEGVYRNHIDEVARFLDQMHYDHYKIYNLCSERSYDSGKFHERVVRYAFDDHTPPKMELIIPFCEDVHSWLNQDPRNVAAVHCKAGKGRTGTMVCCYLLYSGQKATADEALKFYGTKRTHDEKGVTIPSQRRYVEYYAALIRSGLSYSATKVHIRELVMSPPLTLNGGQCTIELMVTQAEPPLKAPAGCQEVRKHPSHTRVVLTQCTPLSGDVRVDVYTKPKIMMRKEKLFHFWFNTFFVANCVGATRVAPPPDSMNLETYKLTLSKWQLDDAHKDKQHKLYAHDFKVELIVQKQPESSTFCAHSTRAPSPPSSSDSSCSEPDTEPDGHWDSGEPHPQPHLPERAAGAIRYRPLRVISDPSCDEKHRYCGSAVDTSCQIKSGQPFDGLTDARGASDTADNSFVCRLDRDGKDRLSGVEKSTEQGSALCCKGRDRDSPTKGYRDSPTQGYRDSPTKGYRNSATRGYHSSSDDYAPISFAKDSCKNGQKRLDSIEGSSVKSIAKGKDKTAKRDSSIDRLSSKNHKKTSVNISQAYVADKDNYTKIRAGEILHTKLGEVRSRSVDDYTTLTVKECGNPNEPIFTDKDNYTTLRSVKKSNKEAYLVCDSPEENLRVCNATMASYVESFDPTELGYTRFRNSEDDNAKMYAEAVKDASGNEFIRFSEAEKSLEGEVVYRSKVNSCPNEECFTLVSSGPASLPDECFALDQPESSKSKKKCPKRDDEKPSEKGKMSKVASDHTISDDTKKKYTFFHRRERDEEGSKPRLSLGDMRASWRGLSGKWAEHRKKKDRDDS